MRCSSRVARAGRWVCDARLMPAAGVALLAVVGGSVLGAGGEGGARMQELVPPEVHGWKADGKDESFDRERLHKYIDGAAEVYLTYGFREVFVRRYVKAETKPIVVEIYDMGSSADAYGIFSFEREVEEREIGQGSEYAAGWLRFWKGRYYVSVLAYPETPAGKAAVLDLGRRIAGAIKREGPAPQLLDYLPRSGLIADSVRYFHQHPCLNYHYFVAEKNILNLDRRTEGVLARYRRDEEKPYLLLIRYPRADKAAAALKSFAEAYMPEAKESGIIRLENGKWTASAAQGEFVVAVFDVPRKGTAEELLDDTLRGLGGKRDE